MEEQKTLIGEKDAQIEEKDTQMEEQKTLIERQRVLIEEVESERVHVVAPSSLSSTLHCCFHEHAKVRIRMLKMEERLKGVPKWFSASQRHPFIPRLLGIVEKEDIPLIEGIDISHIMRDDDDVDGIAIIDASFDGGNDIE
jgi:hypothetical protein